MKSYTSFQSRKKSTGAILDVYEKTIEELKALLREMADAELLEIKDAETKDEDCKSIQTILAHVVNSGIGYVNYIRIHQGKEKIITGRRYYKEVKNYVEDLEQLFLYTEEVLKDVLPESMEEQKEEKKMHVRWGQKYDIEQLMEHAIVHVMRHHRQIEKFLNI